MAHCCNPSMQKAKAGLIASYRLDQGTEMLCLNINNNNKLNKINFKKYFFFTPNLFFLSMFLGINF